MLMKQRKDIPNVEDATNEETLWWGDTDDYTTVYELPDGSVVVEETTDERAFTHWYDCNEAFNDVMAAFTEEGI